MCTEEGELLLAAHNFLSLFTQVSLFLSWFDVTEQQRMTSCCLDESRERPSPCQKAASRPNLGVAWIKQVVKLRKGPNAKKNTNCISIIRSSCFILCWRYPHTLQNVSIDVSLMHSDVHTHTSRSFDLYDTARALLYIAGPKWYRRYSAVELWKKSSTENGATSHYPDLWTWRSEIEVCRTNDDATNESGSANTQ